MSVLGKSALSIQPGERVVEDGKTYRITKHVSADAVLATDIETHRTKVLRVESIAPAPEPDDGNERAGQPALDGYSDEVWALAQRRLAIIKPLLENPQRTRSVMVATAKHHGVGVTTLYRWLNAYESAEQLVALIPEKRGRPKGLRFLTAEQEAIIEVAIKERYLNKRRATEKEVIEYVEQMCRKARVQPPNHNSVRARIHDVPKATALRKRGRPDLARGRYQPLKGSFTGADYPLAVAQIDHTPGDIILVDEVSRKPIGRPWVTLAIDVYSRVVLGLHVSLDNPSFRSVGMCLAQAICSKARYLASLKIEGEWPVWGFMSSIHADNAKEFRGKGLTRACENYGIDLQWRPVGLPEYGGHIERLMGTVAKEFAKIPGKTFANTADRKGYDAEGAAIMTLREFEAYFVDLIVNKYHKTLHSQLGVTPLVQWRRGIEGFGDAPGRGIPPPPADPDRLRLDFLPFIERTIQRYGVQKDHIQYYDPILDPYINSEDEDSSTVKMYTFRYDPSDISRLYFLDPLTNHYVFVPYRNMSHPRISEAERRAAVAELRKQGRADIDEDALFATADRLRARIDEAAASTKAARRAQAKRPPKQPAPPTGSDIDFDAPLPIADPTKPRKALSEPDALRGLFDEPVQAFDVDMNR